MCFLLLLVVYLNVIILLMLTYFLLQLRDGSRGTGQGKEIHSNFQKTKRNTIKTPLRALGYTGSG